MQEGSSKEALETVCDDGSTYTYFIPDRMALIIPPVNPKPVKAKAKKNLRKISSALKDFLDLPLDVIYETFAYLEPRDLLTLARLTKDFRSLFMSRSSITIWRRVLQETPSLPPCPQDLSEPQYASLMYDAFCMACGSSRGAIETDFKTRLRFCATCAKVNVLPAYQVGQQYDDQVLRDAVSMIPFFSLQDFFSDVDGAVHEIEYCYFVPELELALEGLTRGDLNISEQQAIAARMVKEGEAMQEFTDQLIYGRELEHEELAHRRYSRLQEQMLNLGWDLESFSPRVGDVHYVKWIEYLYQPKEFSMRGWVSIRSQLTYIYEETRHLRLIESLHERLRKSYIALCQRQTPDVYRPLAPWSDVCENPFIDEFCDAHHENCSDADIERVMDLIVDSSALFASIAEHSLAHVIAHADSSQKLDCIAPDGDPATASSSNHPPGISAAANSKGKGKAEEVSPKRTPAEMLGLAINVFLCQCYDCSERRSGTSCVWGYPDVVGHAVANANRFMRTWSQLKPQTRPGVINAARDVLEALGLPEDSTRKDVLGKGEFVCECGHYRFEGPLSYDRLVTHVYEQQSWNLRILDNLDHDSEGIADELIVNGHSRERLMDLVRVATEKDRVSSPLEQADPSSSVKPSSDIQPGMYCRHCYRLELKGNVVRNEMMAYHLKYRHGLDVSEDDFADLASLADEYGEHEDQHFFPFGFPTSFFAVFSDAFA